MRRPLAATALAVAAGAEILRLHDVERARRAARPPRAIVGAIALDDRAARRAPPLAWERLLEAGEIDEPPGRDQRRASRAPARTVGAAGTSSRPALAAALRARRDRPTLYSHQVEALEAAARRAT